jgi:5'(3')-deoxyribonucleotidase
MKNLSLLKESIKELFEETTEPQWVFEHGGNPLPHHVSLTKFKPYVGDQLGKIYDIQVLGLAQDTNTLNVAAVAVQLPPEITITTGATPHITVAVTGNGKPFNSQKLQYNNLLPIRVKTVKVQLLNLPTYTQFAGDVPKTEFHNQTGNGQLVLYKADSEALKEAALDALTSQQSNSTGLTEADENQITAPDDIKVFFDMDGVLADFEAGIENDEALKALQAELATLTDKSPEQLKPLLQGKQTDPTMAKIKKIINDIKSQQMRIAKKENFFSNLALMLGAEELVNYAIEKVGSENVYILTAPIEGSATCEPEKRDWIKTNFPSVNIGNFICNASKADHAASNHVLIDDNRKYIDPWVAAGGIGIFHTNPANSDKQLKDILNRRTESEKNTISETYNVKRWQKIAGIIKD